MKKHGTRRKRRNMILVQAGSLLFLITAITVVVILLLKPDDPGPSASSDSVSFSAGPESSSLSSNQPTAAEPTVSASFWGDDIDLAVKSEQIPVSGKYPKWPSEPGFTVPDHDLSIFRMNKGSDRPLTGAVVFIDPGHGGEDLGAVFTRHPIKPEIIESRVNLAVSFILKDLLVQSGAEVVMTREDDYFYRLYYRSAIVARHILSDFAGRLSSGSVNRSVIADYISKMEETIERNDHDDPDDIFYPKGVEQIIKNIFDIQSGYANCIFLSIHCNASAEPDTLKGTKVYYATNASVYELQSKVTKDIVRPEYQNYNDAQRQRLASLIYDEITAALPEMVFTDPQEAVQPTDYSVIRENNVVSALIEMGFVNNTLDREILLDPDHQDEYAKAIFDAIIGYFCG